MPDWNDKKYFKHSTRYHGLLDFFAPKKGASQEKLDAWVNALEDALFEIENRD